MCCQTTRTFHFTLGFFHLQCDKDQISAHIGGQFILTCKYETNRFLYSKKYWCRGDARSTCEILLDSDGVAKTKYTHRSHIIDARSKGLFVKVTDLKIEDTGVYWVGIDKMYADIMTLANMLGAAGDSALWMYKGHYCSIHLVSKHSPQGFTASPLIRLIRALWHSGQGQQLLLHC
uniref:Immunoglobulin V-set domain-containing protein n=1 Tax=Dicentrarchus labrax TaxID=13489 RepID=A0A8C4EGF9_DICLA